MNRGLPIVRHPDVPHGTAYVFPNGTNAWNILSGDDMSLKAGIYVNQSDPRSDEQIREAAGEA